MLGGRATDTAQRPRAARRGHRLRRHLGRQLTRVGAFGQRTRWPAVAEAAFAIATRWYGDPSWWARLGQIREGRQRYESAEAAYQRGVDTANGTPRQRANAAYRLARLRAGRQDWAGAAAAFTSACELRPDVADWQDQQAAVHETIGDWPAAAGLLRELVSRRPADQALRGRLIDCLERWYLTPFSLDANGKATATGSGAAGGALAEAIDHLRQLMVDAPARPGPPHRLGLLYERSGEPAAAIDAYQIAIARLATVDAWWCHRAAHEWAFRLGYVREQLVPSESPDRRLRRSTAPTGPAVPDPAGFFDAVVFRHGLQLSGFLRPGRLTAGSARLRPLAADVDIYVDDQLLKRVQVESTAWRPVLRFDITHGLLDEFPERSRLRVEAAGQPLVTVGGVPILEVRVPGGTGAVTATLTSGQSPTKKGAWPASGTTLAARQERYLDVYERAKVLLAEQGRQLFLCYGTLLGCHREQRFIPGDDDFDVSYVSHAPDPAGFRQECRQVALDLLRQGLDLNLSINGRMFKVGVDGVWIDITPMWFYRGRAWAFDAHDLTPASIEPVRATQFLGREVYVPRDPDGFLADTYGPDWRTPQPGFRYYRSKEDDRVLSQMWAKPSEVRELARLVGAERAGNPSAGRFLGVGYPGYPGFSWLTSDSVPRP